VHARYSPGSGRPHLARWEAPGKSEGCRMWARPRRWESSPIARTLRESAETMTIILTPTPPNQVMRVFSTPSVREIPVPATPAGSAW
jgi:hypothetical protein